MSSLGAAIVFLTARTFGWTRTVAEVCDCFRPSLGHSTEPMRIKGKHCSCAMNEIKSYFPEYARMPTPGSNPAGKDFRSSQIYDSESTSNFVDHFVRNLQLPPVAEASIRTLLVHCRREQIELGVNSGVKMSTLCAGVVYFVCTAGAAMQKAATQVQLNKKIVSKTKKIFEHGSPSTNAKDKKGVKVETKRKIKVEETCQSLTEDSEDDDDDGENSNNDDDVDDDPFDVFTHTAIVENQSEKLEYEMKRMWDAWAEQMIWSRSLLEIEQSCSVSSKSISNFYKANMYPRREILLSVLKTAVSTEQAAKSEASSSANINWSHTSLKQTPLASILLAHISTAGKMMNSK